MLYIDFKNAFGSIDHRRLLFIMSDLGYLQDTINLIENIYSHFNTILTHFGQTQPIPIQWETIHTYIYTYTMRDILSLHLFNIFLEPLLRWLHRKNHSYNFRTSNSRIKSSAYADDLMAIINKPSLQTQLNKLDKHY